jgi:hypothetical protein
VGPNDRAQNRKDDRKKAAENKRQRRNRDTTTAGGADWEGVSGELLTKAIAAVAGMGGALRLGYTRDGGAYAIGVYGDGDPFTEYVKPDDDMDTYLRELIEDYGK